MKSSTDNAYPSSPTRPSTYFIIRILSCSSTAQMLNIEMCILRFMLLDVFICCHVSVSCSIGRVVWLRATWRVRRVALFVINKRVCITLSADVRFITIN